MRKADTAQSENTTVSTIAKRMERASSLMFAIDTLAEKAESLKPDERLDVDTYTEAIKCLSWEAQMEIAAVMDTLHDDLEIA